MSEPFTIDFNLRLDTDTVRLIPMQAQVELHHSIPHYRVSQIVTKGNANGNPILRDIHLICIEAGGERKWVHMDSRQGSEMSKVIGQAIEQTLENIEIADLGDLDPEEE